MQSSHSKPTLPLGVAIIGCGGVASYLLPCLLRTFVIPMVTLFDGDTLEERNLDRQLFSAEHVGMNKAEALATLLRPQFPNVDFFVRQEYFHEGTSYEHCVPMIVCVDNHTARRNALKVADGKDCVVVLAANEMTDSSAMFYRPEWLGTELDPRVRYPELLTNTADDPRRPESCQGAMQEAHPQLAMANFGAANFALWLLWYWTVERNGLTPETVVSFSPVEHSNNFNRFRTAVTGDLAKAQVA